MNIIETKQHFKTYNQSHSSSFFLSFEGIEGAGKTTQIELLTNYLSSKGYEVSKFREPGGTVIGESLRNAILHSEQKLDPLTEAHIFCAARAELLAKKVLPLLAKPNQIVILDRFLDSSLAYQGIARGLGIGTILELHMHFPLNIVPHKTFYLEIDLETSLHRQGKRGNTKDYFEKETNNFYQQLINGFETARKEFSKRICTIDASSDEQSVSKAIIKELGELING